MHANRRANCSQTNAMIVPYNQTKRTRRGNMEYVTTPDGAPIAYHDRGAGRPLLLVHGTTVGRPSCHRHCRYSDPLVGSGL